MAPSLGSPVKLIILLLTFVSLIACNSSRVPAGQPVKETKFLGVDLKDKSRECVDKFDTLECSREFTEADFFALECERGGKFAIQCGCHDWICVDKISSDKELKY